MDDCGPTTVQAPALLGQCREATLNFRATDRCDRLATAVVPVWFDDIKPNVTFSIAPAAALLEKNSTALKGEYTYSPNQPYLSLI